MGLLDYLDTSRKQLGLLGDAEFPVGDIPIMPGVVLNDLLRPLTDNRGDGNMLPPSTSLKRIDHGVGQALKSLSPENVVNAHANAIAGQTPEGVPVEGLERLTGLFPAAGAEGGGLLAPAAERGATALGTYAGRRARTADIPALQKAQRLARKGGDAEPGGEIHNKTGWFRNAGGEWQFEISDDAARLKPHPTDPDQVILDHPDLTAAYPEIDKMPIHLLQPDHEAKGWYGRGGMSPDTGEAGIRRDLSPEERLSVALHELGGHAVQDIEGFSGGSSPRANVALSQQLTQSIFDTAKDKWQSGKMTADEALDWVSEQTQGLSSYDLYHRQLGEYAARDIQARMNLTPAERRTTAPYSSESHNPDDLLTTLNPPFRQGQRRRTSLSAEPAPPDIPIGAAATPPGTPPTHPLIGTTYTSPIDAIDAWKAGGGWASGIKIRQTGPGSWVIEAATGPGTGPTSLPVPGSVGPPATIPGAPGMAHPGRPVVPNNAGTPGTGTGPPPGPPPFTRPVAGSSPPVAVPPGALTDPEGRLITAPTVAGVRTPGGLDEALSMGEERDLANRLFSLGVHDNPSFRANTGYRGQASVNLPGRPNALPGMRMTIDSRLPGDQYERTFRHEGGHGIDFASERTGRTDKLPHSETKNIPPSVQSELEKASGEMRPDLWQRPETEWIGYRHRPSELMADAYRYYKEDPQRFKKLYPDAAKFIRDIVNEDPLLSRHVQFNVQGGPGGLLGASGGDDGQGLLDIPKLPPGLLSAAKRKQ